MQAAHSDGIEFQPNRSKTNLLVLYLACGFFMLLGLVFLVPSLIELISTGNPPDAMGIGAAMFGMGLLFFLIGHFLTSPRKVRYLVGKEGITLSAGKTIRPLPYSEIESMTHLEEKKSEEFLLALSQQVQDKIAEGFNSGSGSGSFIQQAKAALKEQARAHMRYKFLSVAVVYTSSGRRNSRASKADLPCDTVFILLKSGEGYFISPLDIDSFLREAKKHMR